jgi:serine/threonine protein kinase
MLEGKLPFQGNDNFSLIAAVNRHSPKPFSSSTPKYLKKIILKALDKNPEKRYSSAEEMIRDLQQRTAPRPSRNEVLKIIFTVLVLKFTIPAIYWLSIYFGFGNTANSNLPNNTNTQNAAITPTPEIVLNFDDSNTQTFLQEKNIQIIDRENTIIVYDPTNKTGGSGEKLNPLSIRVRLGVNKTIFLNYESKFNNSKIKKGFVNTEQLSQLLNDEFTERASLGVFSEGSNEIYKTVIIQCPKQIEKSFFDAVLKVIQDTGAAPIQLQIDK